jgi:Ca2+-binding EF-hand superfamily protein
LYVSKGISEEDVIMIKKVFDEIDSTSKGILTPSDIKFSLQNCGFNANKETVYDIVAEYDEKEAGGIGFPEFMSIMMRRPGDQ